MNLCAISYYILSTNILDLNDDIRSILMPKAKSATRSHGFRVRNSKGRAKHSVHLRGSDTLPLTNKF